MSGRARHLLFVHHSIGGQWLAAPGPERGRDAIYASSPNGGGLRAALESAGFVVHEAAYGSRIGEHTDLFDWLPTMRDQMDRLSRTAHQDELLPPGVRNEVVIFKSCWPNGAFVGDGIEPGDPRGPELTLANARAAFRELLPLLTAQPSTLFVAVTTPPMAPRLRAAPAWRRAARRLLGRHVGEGELLARARRGRAFADWLVSPEGWRRGHASGNVAVFDYLRVLGDPETGLLRYPTGDGLDPHPSAEGNRRATALLVPFLLDALGRREIAA